MIILYATSYQALKYGINKSENLLIGTGSVPSSKKMRVPVIVCVVCSSVEGGSVCSSCKFV